MEWPCYASFVSFWLSHHFCCLRVCLILLYILVGVHLLWREGCVGFWAYVPYLSSFLWTGCCLGKGLHLPIEPCFSFLCSWASWQLILPYHFIMPAITLPLLLFLITPWACGLMFLPWQPISSSIFCLGLPWLTFHIFTSFGLVSQHSYHARSFHYFIPRASSAYLLLLYPFYSYGIFAKFFRLPHPITTSLPLITFGLISL